MHFLCYLFFLFYLFVHKPRLFAEIKPTEPMNEGQRFLVKVMVGAAPPTQTMNKYSAWFPLQTVSALPQQHSEAGLVPAVALCHPVRGGKYYIFDLEGYELQMDGSWRL